MNNVAIVGAGPAGLLAAWGAVTTGAEVRIFDPSPDYPKTILGLQYLHTNCDLPFAARKKLTLKYELVPCEALTQLSISGAYNRKLGRPLDEPNSTRFLDQHYPVEVYSLKTAYEYLHHQFRYDIITRAVTWKEIVVDLAEDFDVVINTAPLDKLLPDWGWPTRDAWIQFSLPEGVQVPDGTCVYNLDPEVPWYRATHLDGAVSTEYLYAIADGMMDVPGRLLRKVVKTALPGPLPLNVFLAGRWGSWDPQALTSDAFKVAREACK